MYTRKGNKTPFILNKNYSIENFLDSRERFTRISSAGRKVDMTCYDRF